MFNSTGKLGSYDVCKSLHIELDEKKLKELDRYEEVYFHEFTHFQLTTTTTVGHILQWLHSDLNPEFKRLSKGFMLDSFMPQEGAATYTQWYYFKKKFPDITFLEFAYSIPKEYGEAVSCFHKIYQTLMPLGLEDWLPIFSNALGQYCLNTNIIDKMYILLGVHKADIESTFGDDVYHYASARLKKLYFINDVESARKIFSEHLRRGYSEVAQKFLGLVDENRVLFQFQENGNLSQDSILIRDIVNKHMYLGFHDVAGIKPWVTCAKDVSQLFQDFRSATYYYPNSLHPHYDMSSNIHDRSEFFPTIKTTE